MHLRILYLRHQGTILVAQRMSLHISTITNCELFKTVTLYNDNTYSTGHMQHRTREQILSEHSCYH